MSILLTDSLETKYNYLKNFIAKLGSVAVAFSGGTDSSLLCAVSQSVLQNKCLALTCDSFLVPRSEIEDAISVAKALGINHCFIKITELDKAITSNPKDRCYFCKKFIFSKLIDKAKSLGINTLIDGTNIDDNNDYRPGTIAAKELGVISPFKEAMFTKKDIIALSTKLNLQTALKPAFACLATRLPVNEEITKEKLFRIENAESFLRKEGFANYRVRCHANLARIEIEKKEMNKIFCLDMFAKISDYFKTLGFAYTTLDLNGYKQGSMNTTEGNK